LGANPETLCPAEFGARLPLPGGRVNLSALASGYVNSGSGLAGKRSLEKCSKAHFAYTFFRLVPRAELRKGKIRIHDRFIALRVIRTRLKSRDSGQHFLLKMTCHLSGIRRPTATGKNIYWQERA
jgi:hypothetical protein